MPRTLKLTLSYDGSNYSGWQRQVNGPSVQAVLEDELSAVIGTPVTIMAAGRTDAGVHAAGQVASATFDHPIGCDDLVRALNARLPEDVRVRHAKEMFAGFDARIYAKSKTYRYAIWNGGAPNPFFRHVVWHVPQRLDIDRMSRAAALLVGEHDFEAFQAAGSAVKTTVRTLLQSELREVDIHTDQPIAVPPVPGEPERVGGRLVRYEVTGTGFLRHMVRTIVGTLVEVGRGRMAIDDMAAVIRSRDRARAGQTAPPQGLMLWEVKY
jgi:tRNA pseudouridine38-40 synthase